MAKVISVNAGSSSLKFQLFEMPNELVLTSGIVERIGFEDAYFTINVKGEKIKKILAIKDHKIAVDLLLNALVEYKIVESLTDITGIGHRVVHGGEFFNKSVECNDDVIAKVQSLVDLAPLHNPANLVGYQSFKSALPTATQVMVFDTAFHQTMEPAIFLYPLPYEYYLNYKIRRYGFHGTSHMYVSQRVATLMNKAPEKLNIITCHLGNGASLAAIQAGISINTSMGFTPLSGVMMGTRTGDIDPQIMPFLEEKLDLNSKEITDIYNKMSGMLGVSGISSDARDIENALKDGDKRALLTRQMYATRITNFIGSYYIQLGHIDAIVFTAGLGENDGGVRADILDILRQPLKIEYDIELNKTRGKEIKISTDDSKIEVWVIPTNEELVIARDTFTYMK